MRAKEWYLIAFISFFLYTGYYTVLTMIISSGNIGFSGYFSIPLRLLLSVIMIYLVFNNAKRIKRGTIILLNLFTALYFVKVWYSASFFSENALSRYWLEYIFYFTSYCYLPFLTFISIDFKKYSQVIVKSIIFSGFTLGVICMYLFNGLFVGQGIARISLLTAETGEAVISPLALSYSGVLTIVLCVYQLIYFKNEKRGIKIYYFLSIGLSLALFFLGASRGSLIALVLCAAIFLFVTVKRNKIKLVIIFFVGLFLLIKGAELTGSAIFTRMDNTIEEGNSGGRESLYAEALKEFVNYPIFGGRVEVSGVYPHNLFVEILMGTGIVGFIIFIIFLHKALKNGLSNYKENKEYLFAILILALGFSLSMFSGAIYGATLLFAPIGLLLNRNRN